MSENTEVLSKEKAEVLIKSLETAREEIAAGRTLSKTNQEKMEKDLGSVLDTTKSLTKSVEEADVKNKALQEQLDIVEKQMRRPVSGDALSNRKEVLMRVERALLHGEGAREMKVLSTDSNIDGGFLVAPADFVQEIDKDIVEMTPVLTAAGGVRIRNTDRNEVIVNRRITRPTTAAVKERKSFPNSQSSYGRVSIKVHKQAVETIITREDLDDSAFNMEAEIMFDVNEDFAQKIGEQVINGGGDSVNEANGILKNADILANGVTNSGASGGIGDPAIFMDFLGTLKTGYRRSLWMNRQILYKFWALKGTDGQFIFNFGNFAASQGPQIQGIPVIEAPDMPLLAADALIVAYGDFGRGYLFVQNTQLMMIRDEITLASEDEIKFTFRRRYGGDVLRPEAIKLYKAAA